MKCKQCGKEVAGRSQYCSESCKTVYNRNKRKAKPEQTVTGTVPEQETGTGLDGVMFDELYRRVRAYPGLDWKTSPEYREIMHRLHTLTVEQLELEGQFVPCWKYKREEAA